MVLSAFLTMYNALSARLITSSIDLSLGWNKDTPTEIVTNISLPSNFSIATGILKIMFFAYF